MVGLTNDQVLASRQEHGSNTLTKKKRRGFVLSFFTNFGDPMLKILLIALGIQVVFIFNSGQWIETFGIALAILVAVTVSTVSEYGSEKAFEKLSESAQNIELRVRRNGQTQLIAIADIVVGDIVLLGSGDKIPADGRIVQGSIEVDQSLLNGESKEAKKTAGEVRVLDGLSKSQLRSVTKDQPAAVHRSSAEIAFGESSLSAVARVDYLDGTSLFSGTVVTNGNCMMVVTTVGENTEYGKIAKELQEVTPKSPLKVKLEGLAKMISVIGYIGAGLVALSYFFNLLFIRNGFDMALVMENLRDGRFMFEHILKAATLVVSVIVMAVPEGLPMMITVVLSSNMKHMLRDNVLVRKLNGIETAGSMNILFTDKTGTLTCGKMAVTGIVLGCGEHQEINKFGRGSQLAKLLGTSLTVNNSAEMMGNRAIGGNSTDRILLQFGNSLPTESVVKVSEVPFNSATKFMSSTLGDGRVLYKGASEVLLPKCRYYFSEDGVKKSLNQEKLKSMTRSLAGRAYRLIAVVIDDTLVCFVAMRDEVRKEAKSAVSKMTTAGIQTVMITGDAKETAVAVAKEVGILAIEKDKVLTSDEMALMTDKELEKILPSLRVVARALPSDKSRLVRIAQGLNLVTGMTGDGVNDAPALKKADIGFAVGSGTEVAKEAGDIVILDDNINSIAKAVSYGRTIFKSIRKFLIFKLTINFVAVTVSIVAPLLSVDTPITVIQMLWINLVMDTLAGLAYGGERPRAKYMTEPPKRRDEPIINKYMWQQILSGSIFVAVLSLWFLKSSFMAELHAIRGPAYYMTAFFAFFMLINIFNSFNSRTHDLNLTSYLALNKPFIMIMGIVTVVQFTMLYIGGSVFRTTPLNFSHLVVVATLALTIIPFDMFRKLICNPRADIMT